MRRSAASARFVAVLAASLALASGLRLAAPAEPHGPRDLVIGITQFPSTLHPLIDSMLAKSYVLGLARRPMMVYDHDWKHACMLCTEVPSIEAGTAAIEPLPDGGEGMAVSYALDPRARWGDGTPITTRDVVFTWEVGRHPQSGVAAHSYYLRILSIDVHDEHRYTVHYDRLDYDYPTVGAFSLLPEHLERDLFEEDPATYRNRTRYETEPGHPGLYHGPYRVTEVVRGSHLRFERNPEWWGREPYFERIVVRTIENTVALEANLLSETVDFIAGELGLPIDQAIAFEERHGDRFVVEYKPGLIYEHLTPSFDNPILRDPRVRRALLTGLDREAISERLFGGRQPVAATNVNPLDWNPFRGDPKVLPRPGRGGGAPRRGGVDPGRRRHPAQRRRRAPSPRAHDHRRGPHPGARGAGHPEPVARARGGRADPERTPAGLLRRHRGPPQVHRLRDVRVDLVAGRIAAGSPALGGDPAPRERLERQQRGGVREPGGGPAHRRHRGRARPQAPPRALGGAPVPLRRGPPRPPPLLPGQRLHPAEVAGRGAPDRAPVLEHPLDRGVAPRARGGLTPAGEGQPPAG